MNPYWSFYVYWKECARNCRKGKSIRIFFRYEWRHNFPPNGDFGIIPEDVVLVCGIIKIAAFIEKLDSFRQRYKSQTLVLVQQPSVPDDYVKPVVSEGTSERLATMQQEILSRTRLEPIIQQFGLYPNDMGRASMEDLVGRLRKAITVTPVEPMAQTRAQGLPGFTISVEFSDAGLTQRICSSITAMFMEENLKLRQNLAEQTTQFLAKQLEDAKAKLDDQDSKLADFERHYLGSLPDDEQRNINILLGLNTELDSATQAISHAQQDKTFAESALSQQLAVWRASQDGHNPQTQKGQLAALENQLAELQSKYTDEYPDVIRVKRDIEEVKKKIAENSIEADRAQIDKPTGTPAEPGEIRLLRTQIHESEEVIKERTQEQAQIQQRIKLYQSRIEASPEIEEEYKHLTRDYQTALGFYNDLLKKRDQSAMATDLERRQQGEQFQVLDPANLPDNPSFPKKLNFGFGGLAAGMAFGFAITIVLEMQDTSLKGEKDVENLLHLPVLSTVPLLKPISEPNRSAAAR